jgi:GT2 family glycosyltransferase/glycosyltransferase involved in cell wall biosynthesis
MRVLHAIHDFLPRHRAGSEIYAANLCRAQRAIGLSPHVLCAEYDARLEHGSLRWRRQDGIGVTEITNNWAFQGFEDTYRSPLLRQQLAHVLRAIRPDVLHVHNLLNLSFDLPSLAREMAIPTVATLHDYTLVCPSGGQRVHQAEEHVCVVIDPDRCARCFAQHNLGRQLLFGQLVLARGHALKSLAQATQTVRRRMPAVFGALAGTAGRVSEGSSRVTAAQISARLDQVRRVFDDVDVFIAPSPHLATEYRRLGLPDDKLRVSDYGFVRFDSLPRRLGTAPLRIGFVGTLVWHKGAHILLEAARMLPPAAFEIKLFGDVTTFPDYVATLRSMSYGLPVQFMGGFDHDRITEVYRSIDLLVVPSLWPENSPLVIHEAFMAGLPIVGSREGGTKDLVTHGINGLLYEAFSPSSLAAALRALIDDPEQLARLAARVPDVKPIEHDALELAGIYDEVTSRVARAARKVAPPRATIAVLLNYRTPDDALTALESIASPQAALRGVVLVDNGSHDGCEDYLRQHAEGATIISNDVNLGFSGGCNVGVRAALDRGADRILLLNADTVLTADSLALLQEALDGDPTLGIVGPTILSRANPEVVLSRGMRFLAMTGRMRHRGFGDASSKARCTEPVDVDGVNGCAMLIRRAVFERVGLLDEEYFFGFEDLDYCLRARAAGFRTACVERAVALHEGNVSIGPRSSSLIYFATRNHLLLGSRIHASPPMRQLRSGAIVLFNLAHVLFSSDVPLSGGLRGFAEGLRDHLNGRYGQHRRSLPGSFAQAAAGEAQRHSS